MFELIGLGVAGLATVAGHVKSRKFVGRRLRFTNLVEKPYLSIAAGVATAVVAAPILPLVPFLGLGTGTALLLGAGVGTGVALGARDAKEPLSDEDL